MNLYLYFESILHKVTYNILNMQTVNKKDVRDVVMNFLIGMSSWFLIIH